MNECVINNISVGKFVVHGGDCRECGKFVLTVPQKLDPVFVGKRMLETLNGDFCALVYAVFFRPSQSFKVVIILLGISLRPW